MRVIRTAVVLVYHAKSVLRKDSPSSITPELRSRRILCTVDYSCSSTWYVLVLDISTYLYQACIRAGESHKQQCINSRVG